MKYTIKYDYDSFYKNPYIARAYKKGLNGNDILVDSTMSSFSYADAKKHLIKILKDLNDMPVKEEIEI